MFGDTFALPETNNLPFAHDNPHLSWVNTIKMLEGIVSPCLELPEFQFLTPMTLICWPNLFELFPDVVFFLKHQTNAGRAHHELTCFFSALIIVGISLDEGFLHTTSFEMP